jgi:antitoxin VapB
MTIATTRVFKSGNSLAVRIPKDMTPKDMPQEAEIEYKGGVWIIRPLRQQSMADVMDIFASFPKNLFPKGRLAEPEHERDWPQSARKADAKAPAKRK